MRNDCGKVVNDNAAISPLRDEELDWDGDGLDSVGALQDSPQLIKETLSKMKNGNTAGSS